MKFDFKEYKMQVDCYHEIGDLIKEMRPKAVTLFKDNKKNCLIRLYPDGVINSYISDISEYLSEQDQILRLYSFNKDGILSDEFTFYPDGSFSDNHLFNIEGPLVDLKESVEAICYLLEKEISTRFPAKLMI